MAIEDLYNQFNELFNRAVVHIESIYMKFEAVGLLDGFMERTYAYELYHQLRCAQEVLDYKDFVIHAEPQKQRTLFFRKIIERLINENDNPNKIAFQKSVMPDMLVHMPNNIDINIAMLEVKPEKKQPGKIPEDGQPWRGFAKDIRVIKEFLDGGDDVQGYYRGISLLYKTDYGFNSEDEIKNSYAGIIKGTLGDAWEEYQDRILLLWHKEPASEVVQIPWYEN
ncbi:hypothetical protein DO021_17615 [Desulfobacter hydrogenophilus]|uniref:Uncharacterized protein n=1 Tax=Desulfobacter hydrogenophilus TaxID=2291 RepID=A0A328FB84_9BACT|nr:hypothetical protein [Desulfobacter hydrogenophilus]NDY73510.1 hypothetical protein [Desulfobacter hydrogenophilus]QBH15733.1 hypothetical protein EYB58_22950 [Desulfobacter hydrogenophilus]RAM00692.1 hypothetical protein DO021_17615 [Desulfobacter hydrogenophilus]